MGWDYSSAWQTKKDMVEHLTTKALGDHLKVVGHSVRGNTLWMLVERTKDWGEEKAGARFILCCLMASQRGFGWGFKDMDETMEPYYYDCPLSLIDRAGPCSEAAQRWRDKCRAHAAKKASLRKVEPGMRIRLVDKCSVRGVPLTEPLKVLSVKPLTCASPVGTVRVKPSHIAEILPAE